MVPSTPTNRPPTPLSPERAFQEVLDENPGHSMVFYTENKGKVNAIAGKELMHRAARHFLSEATTLNEETCWNNFAGFYRELSVWCGVPGRSSAEEAVLGTARQLEECFRAISDRFHVGMTEKRRSVALRRSRDKQVARFSEQQGISGKTKIAISAIFLVAAAALATYTNGPGACNCEGCGDPENPAADTQPDDDLTG
ncbi:hypothetical protein HN748_05220 [Candidatus Peregrinibacteria bacterium]|jgi:hypothetical protein|nr:hypothetical protein [Candidatus Peregrinibacteria bacterium]MBT7703609.1 hypothetical protein [Candidatus Peregrinibacteria bacterium]